MATYNSRVIGEFEHTPCVTRATRNPTTIRVSYVGECKEILELDYGVIEVPVLLCSWAQVAFKLAQKRMSLVSPSSTLEGYCQCGSNHLSSLHMLNNLEGCDNERSNILMCMPSSTC